jgi:hypothetical protein
MIFLISQPAIGNMNPAGNQVGMRLHPLDQDPAKNIVLKMGPFIFIPSA